jgi:hypothetical protein
MDLLEDLVLLLLLLMRLGEIIETKVRRRRAREGRKVVVKVELTGFVRGVFGDAKQRGVVEESVRRLGEELGGDGEDPSEGGAFEETKDGFLLFLELFPLVDLVDRQFHAVICHRIRVKVVSETERIDRREADVSVRQLRHHRLGWCEGRMEKHLCGVVKDLLLCQSMVGIFRTRS